MKTDRKIWDYTFRPFQFIAGGKALIFGVLTMLALLALCYATNTYFDGAIDAHYGCGDKAVLPHIYCIFGLWLIMVAVSYITSLLAGSKKTRLIDIAGTFAMAKFPLIISALIGFLPLTKALCGFDLASFHPTDTETIQQLMTLVLKMLPALIVTVAATIWYIVLLYNAYSVSANLRGTKGVLTFIAALIASEVLTKVFLGIVL